MVSATVLQFAPSKFGNASRRALYDNRRLASTGKLTRDVNATGAIVFAPA